MSRTSPFRLLVIGLLTLLILLFGGMVFSAVLGPDPEESAAGAQMALWASDFELVMTDANAALRSVHETMQLPPPGDPAQLGPRCARLAQAARAALAHMPTPDAQLTAAFTTTFTDFAAFGDGCTTGGYQSVVNNEPLLRRANQSGDEAAARYAQLVG